MAEDVTRDNTCQRELGNFGLDIRKEKKKNYAPVAHII